METLNPQTPESSNSSPQNTAWDNLAKIAESETWDEHLSNANSLIKKTEDLTSAETRSFLDYNDVAKQNKKNFYQDLAQQELLERKFNSELSHVEDLELLAEAGDPSVEKTSLKYQNQDIPVFILKNYPLKFLGHIINYREGDNISEIGTQTSDELVNNPKKWFESYQKPENSELTDGGWNIDRKSSRSNTLSTSYVDGTLQGYDRGLAQGNGQHGKSIIYGFDHVRPTTLIYAKNSDGQIPNYIKQGDGYYNRGIKSLVSDPSELNSDEYTGYNEVAMFRYDDSGKPLEPSFIITDDPSVLLDTEFSPEKETQELNGEQYTQKTSAFYKNRMKKHALEHEIPIILIDRNAYGGTSERDITSADEYIAEHCSSILAAGVNPEFVKSKLSAEAAWDNYDTLKTYLPDLNVNTEFDNLVNSRYSQEVTKRKNGSENVLSETEQKKAYADVVYDALGSDVYDFLSRGGNQEKLLEMASRTDDAEVINYTNQLLASMGQ